MNDAKKLTKNVTKSTYKTTKNYLFPSSSSNENEKMKLSWTSFMVLYKDSNNNLTLDQAYIFIGDLPEHFHAYYINFINWSYHSKILFKGPEKIDPNQVHLHVHVGDTIFESDYFRDNPTYPFHFFSNPKNKIYQVIKNQLIPSKIKVINLTDSTPLLSKISLKDRCERISDLRFLDHKRQMYGENMDHLMLTGLDLNFL